MNDAHTHSNVGVGKTLDPGESMGSVSAIVRLVALLGLKPPIENYYSKLYIYSLTLILEV